MVLETMYNAGMNGFAFAVEEQHRDTHVHPRTAPLLISDLQILNPVGGFRTCHRRLFHFVAAEPDLVCPEDSFFGEGAVIGP
jgi:hypothetical protein